MAPRLTDKARKAIFAKGKRSRALDLQTKGGPRQPGVTSMPDTVRAPKVSTLNRKSNSWQG